MKETTKKIILRLFERYPALEVCSKSIWDACGLLIDCARNNSTVLVCGNGGSAADSEHIVGELMKGFLLKRELTPQEKQRFAAFEGGAAISVELQRPVRAISLVSQSALISAYANDIGSENVFAQQVLAYAQRPSDLLIAMSTTGNSVNTVNAVITANACNIKSIAITGSGGGALEGCATVTVKLPENETFAVQELTVPLYHALCAAVENEMFT